MSSGSELTTASADRVVTGNTYDKYATTNPVMRRLMRAFERDLDELFERAAPRSLLDIGCGEGVLTEQWARRLGDGRVVGVDLEDPKLRSEWGTRQAPNLEYRALSAERLPFADGEFDVATAIEVLEHLPRPEQTLSEMARCAQRYLIVSVPREPLWRALNLARGAYVRDFGNTPGHLNHWSQGSFVRMVSRVGDIVETRSPLPWTMLLVRL